MSDQAKTINFDFQSDTVTNTNTAESLGIALMRLAAKATRSIDYTGLSHANRLISKVLPSERAIQTTLFEDTKFEFPYGDGYWGSLLDNKITYSPSEEKFLLAIRDVDYAFIDCGANFGYMSSIVSSDTFGNKPSYAIEADPTTFEKLRTNWELNDQRFDYDHKAIFSKSGEWVNIGGAKHEARHIDNDTIGKSNGNVQTLALNDLKKWITKQKREHLILKLDVEGVEIDALKGADKLLKGDPCIMFEDHASDETNEVSAYLNNQLGMDLFYSDENGCRELNSLDEVSAIKTNPRVGYDFIAARGTFWPKLIKGLRY